MPNFSEKIIEFNKNLSFSNDLPSGIKIMNPFKENPDILKISASFYTRFYNDNKKRKIILGINPGSLGSGTTGIPFTDTKRLLDYCGIDISSSITTHEPSSVFIYKLIEKYGGAEKFYKKFYINAICPLGFIIKNPKGNWVNCNYYDYENLFESTKAFIVNKLYEQIKLGIDTETCYILGKKNAKFFKIINDEKKLFNSIVVFDHPRYIEQYKSNQRNEYIDDYLSKLIL